MSRDMEIWRQKALAEFPCLRADLSDNGFSVYMLFFELVPMVREAHRTSNTDLQRRIYEFAEWCFSQEEKDLWNSAGVAFYEHLFDEPDHWEQTVSWLSLGVIEGCWSLWTYSLSYLEVRRLRAFIQRRFPQWHPERA